MRGKVAFLTGAASGIGAEVARQLASAGVKVALCDVNQKLGSALAAELGGLYVHCDVSDPAAVDAAVAECVERLGVPDYAHLNAGVMTVPSDQPFLAIEDVSVEQYRRIMGINVDGVFHGLKSLLPCMRERGGAITVTASIAGLVALPIDPLYAASKHGLIGLTRAVAAANADTALRINAVCPGVVDTAIVPEAMRRQGLDAMPATVLAAEVVDLLRTGANGEVRVKMSKDVAGFDVAPPELRAGPRQ